jgi:hypothetical protein
MYLRDHKPSQKVCPAFFIEQNMFFHPVHALPMHNSFT